MPQQQEDDVTREMLMRAQVLMRAQAYPAPNMTIMYLPPHMYILFCCMLIFAQGVREEPLSVTSLISSLTEDEDEPGHPGVNKVYLDFLFKQLRTVCYRKVRVNDNDVSIRVSLLLATTYNTVID